MIDTITLWRSAGSKELARIKDSGLRTFPPLLPEQPIFCPVTSEAYATRIARDWNVRASGAGFVTRFAARRDFLELYDVQAAGGRAYQEYWIPAEDLDRSNQAIVGEIDVVAEFCGERQRGE